MDQKTQEKLNSIVKKEVRNLTEDDIRFLKARRTYLSVQDEEKFKDILVELKSETKKVKKTK